MPVAVELASRVATKTISTEPPAGIDQVPQAGAVSPAVGLLLVGRVTPAEGVIEVVEVN